MSKSQDPNWMSILWAAFWGCSRISLVIVTKLCMFIFYFYVMLWKHISVFLVLGAAQTSISLGRFLFWGVGMVVGDFLPPYLFKFYALNWSQNTLPNGFSNFQYRNWAKIFQKIEKNTWIYNRKNKFWKFPNFFAGKTLIASNPQLLLG